MFLNQRWQFTFDLVPIIQQAVIPYVKNIHENPYKAVTAIAVTHH